MPFPLPLNIYTTSSPSISPNPSQGTHRLPSLTQPHLPSSSPPSKRETVSGAAAHPRQQGRGAERTVEVAEIAYWCVARLAGHSRTQLDSINSLHTKLREPGRPPLGTTAGHFNDHWQFGKPDVPL
ncbi:hypothetical protein Pcinc_026537 [Petrolisthes cinctipes]|uniref:Uncharacterized protein n=1 Tax=Petrolisthes cinctipes TaxID=88211 RepID=A0AAE1KBH8_PETCI|nr:hypothetical protein Pcinc_026537 [Petrolisthes cinctipes]